MQLDTCTADVRQEPTTETVTRVSPTARTARARHYLMCPPTHFAVDYAINPWMDPGITVDHALATSQWRTLVHRYRELGHRVSMIDPLPGLPDMVFAANGATVIDGCVYTARFRHDERAQEATAYHDWLTRNGFSDVRVAEHVNEGEGDFLVTNRWILAGTGFRTHPASHAELQEWFGRPVVGLQLIDPRFYHLDTALAVLDGDQVMYYPDAFSPGSRAVLGELFPDAIVAEHADATVLGLNAVSDGRNVLLAAEARGLAAKLAERGFTPFGVEMSELRKAGGSVKCCTLELRT